MGTSQELQESLLEALVRQAMRRRRWVEKWFVGGEEGTSFPDDLLGKLNRSHETVFARASEAVRDAHGFVHDPQSGELAWLLTVCIVRWVDDKSAEVWYSDYRDPEAAGGEKGTARLVDGQWTFEFFTSWNS